MTHKLEIREYNIPRAHGDRALDKSVCYDFKVYLNGILIRTFSQYDPHHCSVNNYDKTVQDVLRFTDGLADAISAPRPFRPVRYIERRVCRTDWVPL